MPTVQQGPIGTINLLEDLIVQEMMQNVAVLETSSKPLTTVMNNLEKVVATDTPEPQHAEDELLPTIDLVNGAHTAADVTIAVDNPVFYLVGDILHIPRTGENMRVTSAPGVSPITVTRGIGQTPPAALNDDDPIWILGCALEEGASSRLALNTLEIPFTHYCQIIRNSIEGTGTQLATRQLGGDYEDQAEKKLIEHKKQMEYFFKFGRSDRRTVNGEYMRTMGGIFERIQINRFAVNGVLGEGAWEAGLEAGFQFGSARKLFIAAPRVLRAISNFARNRLITVPEDESYGLVMRRYESHSGTVDLVSDRELKGAVYGGYGALLDPDYIIVRYLRAGPDSGRPAKYQGSSYCKRIENIQANDADRRKDEFFSELTLQLVQERVHMVLTGVTG
jgi:hypothetical protein